MGGTACPGRSTYDNIGGPLRIMAIVVFNQPCDQLYLGSWKAEIPLWW